jgi:hypothetical protein
MWTFTEEKHLEDQEIRENVDSKEIGRVATYFDNTTCCAAGGT